MKKILLLVMLGLSTSVFSQQTDTTTELEEVVITATRSEISLEDSPIPTEVIGKKEIEQLKQEHNEKKSERAKKLSTYEQIKQYQVLFYVFLVNVCELSNPIKDTF